MPCALLPEFCTGRMQPENCPIFEYLYITCEEAESQFLLLFHRELIPGLVCPVIHRQGIHPLGDQQRGQLGSGPLQKTGGDAEPECLKGLILQDKAQSKGKSPLVMVVGGNGVPVDK